MAQTFRPGSRYERTRAFDPDPAQGEVFRGARARDIGSATGVVEHVVKAGDRLDLLARHYYNHPQLWWRIVDANPAFLFGGEVTLQGKEGPLNLIPRAPE